MFKNLNKNEKITLAQNTTNRELLKVLSKENDKDINLKLAKNENTPLEVFNGLKYNYLYKVALNENYSFKKYDELMNDESFSKMNPIKQETIVKMFRIIDNKEDISINLCKVFINIDYEPLLKKIASYEKTPTEVLKKLYELKSNIVDYPLASNPNCPQNIIEELAMKGDYFLYINLASNPNCPQGLLKELAKINDEYINVKLAENPNCPQNVLEGLSEEVIRKKEYNNRPYFEISDYVEPSYNDFDR